MQNDGLSSLLWCQPLAGLRSIEKSCLCPLEALQYISPNINIQILGIRTDQPLERQGDRGAGVVSVDVDAIDTVRSVIQRHVVHRKTAFNHTSTTGLVCLALIHLPLGALRPRCHEPRCQHACGHSITNNFAVSGNVMTLSGRPLPLYNIPSRVEEVVSLLGSKESEPFVGKGPAADPVRRRFAVRHRYAITCTDYVAALLKIPLGFASGTISPRLGLG